jgi:hypothetical protein
MPEANILGVNFWIVAMITIFFCVVAMLLLGTESLENSAIASVIVMFTLGLTLLIGHFGWAILIFPSILILIATGLILKQHL